MYHYICLLSLSKNNPGLDAYDVKNNHLEHTHTHASGILLLKLHFLINRTPSFDSSLDHDDQGYSHASIQDRQEDEDQVVCKVSR